MEKKPDLTLQSIGAVRKTDDAVKVVLNPEYGEGLESLDGFGHVMVLWWADKYVDYRNQVDMVIDLPYAPGRKAGLFATRSPVRPNPVCVSTAEIMSVSTEARTLVIDEIDAADGTPVLDVKPYYGTSDRVETYSQPNWVPAEWPIWRVPIPEEDYGEES
jgi:tRNA-Thr(GGU) m(6)t(6)A37 methyltransferase TsaA